MERKRLYSLYYFRCHLRNDAYPAKFELGVYCRYYSQKYRLGKGIKTEGADENDGTIRCLKNVKQMVYLITQGGTLWGSWWLDTMSMMVLSCTGEVYPTFEFSDPTFFEIF